MNRTETVTLTNICMIYQGDENLSEFYYEQNYENWKLVLK